eukprot:6943496-Pyramimonas_sp.AAC.1
MNDTSAVLEFWCMPEVCEPVRGDGDDDADDDEDEDACDDDVHEDDKYEPYCMMVVILRTRAAMGMC